MRKDLNKLLCERERRSSRARFHDVRRLKKFQPRGEDDAPLREGINARPRVTGDCKEFNENLNPLKGQIRKALNKPWDKFYSELSKVFDKRSVINQHILTHLDDFIERDLYVADDGEIYRRGRYGGPDQPLDKISSEFYVDPRDGIIKRNKRYRKSPWRLRAAERAEEEAARAAVFRQLDEGNVLHKIGDVWFHFTVKDAPIGRYVYEKPNGVELFKPHKWSKARTWERLADYERKHCGVRRFVGESAVDAASGETVFSEAGEPPKKYYATKRTASHKLLKQAGLVT